MRTWFTAALIPTLFLCWPRKPLVEIAFMSEALSTRPEPYRHFWKPEGGAELFETLRR